MASSVIFFFFAPHWEIISGTPRSPRVKSPSFFAHLLMSSEEHLHLCNRLWMVAGGAAVWQGRALWSRDFPMIPRWGGRLGWQVGVVQAPVAAFCIAKPWVTEHRLVRLMHYDSWWTTSNAASRPPIRLKTPSARTWEKPSNTHASDHQKPTNHNISQQHPLWLHIIYSPTTNHNKNQPQKNGCHLNQTSATSTFTTSQPTIWLGHTILHVKLSTAKHSW